jgi:hypothetical protein
MKGFKQLHDQIKEDCYGLGHVALTEELKAIQTEFQLKRLKKRDQLEERGGNGRTISELILNK